MRIFGDGFDQYGDDEGNMLDGVYARADGSLSTANPVTGTHSWLISAEDISTGFRGLRKVIPSPTNKMGAMGHFYFPTLPSFNNSITIFDFLTSSANISHVACNVDSNGCLRFYHGRGAGSTDGTNIATSDPIVVPSAHNHIEVQIYIHDTDGWIRAAINGVHRYEVTGLDTKNSTDGLIYSVAQHKRSGTSDAVNPYMDNYILYDFTGTPATVTDFCPTYDAITGIATGYIGELEGIWSSPNADTAEDDWAPSTGSDAYAMVDETTPNDADYITSSAIGDLSEYALTDLPVEVTYIRGVDVWGRMSKSDAGAAMIKFGMKSVADTSDAAERPLTTEPTYWWDQVNVDPDSGARWTRDSFNAAWVRLTRSA